MSKKNSKTFKNYEEAMAEMFPAVWQKRKEQEEKRRRKNMSPRELAESVMSTF